MLDMVVNMPLQRLLFLCLFYFIGETVDRKVETVEEMATIGRSNTMMMLNNLMFLRKKLRD